MLDYQRILCVFIVEKSGMLGILVHLEKHALEKNLGYVKQIWVRKDDLSMLKRMRPKKSWVPKTNH